MRLIICSFIRSLEISIRCGRRAAGYCAPVLAKTLGVLKIGSPEVSLYAVFTVRQDCRAAIPH
jgi:hypothetical protein